MFKINVKKTLYDLLPWGHLHMSKDKNNIKYVLYTLDNIIL